MPITSKEKSQEIYLRYLRLLLDLEKLPANNALNIGERQLLNAIAVKVQSGQKLMIGDITLMREIASPATIHTRLKSLRAKKMIRFVLGEDDRRKYVEPSELAYQYFAKVGQLIIKASSSKK